MRRAPHPPPPAPPSHTHIHTHNHTQVPPLYGKACDTKHKLDRGQPAALTDATQLLLSRSSSKGLPSKLPHALASRTLANTRRETASESSTSRVFSKLAAHGSEAEPVSVGAGGRSLRDGCKELARRLQQGIARRGLFQAQTSRAFVQSSLGPRILRRHPT